MRGCRPLTLAESAAMYAAYAGPYAQRNRCLHMLCVTSGLRVSEALSLRVGDVLKKGAVVRRVQIARANIKRARAGRTIELTEQARLGIARQLQWLLQNGLVAPQEYLFRSRKSTGKETGQPLGRREAWRIFNAAARRAGLDEDMGRLGTHSWRKTYADEVNKHFIARLRNGDSINPMLETSRALGHASVESTEKYLSFNLGCQQSARRHLEARHSYAN